MVVLVLVVVDVVQVPHIAGHTSTTVEPKMSLVQSATPNTLQSAASGTPSHVGSTVVVVIVVSVAVVAVVVVRVVVVTDVAVTVVFVGRVFLHPRKSPSCHAFSKVFR